MSEAIYYYSTFVSSATFLAFIVGTIVLRKIPVWFPFYCTMLIGYICIYSMDMVAKIFESAKEVWSVVNRQAVARTLICYCVWLPIILYLRNPRLLIELYQYLSKQPPTGERAPPS